MIIVFIYGACCAIAYFWLFNKRRLPLPPGPPADPIIGHLRLVSGQEQHTLFHQWGEIYGDVIYLKILGRSIIVLNSYKAAVDLLEKRSTNYSDRPSFIIYELMGWVNSLTFTAYGKTFQRHRRMFMQYFNKAKCISYQSVQTREARALLQNLLLNSERREEHLVRFATAIIMQITYGHHVKSDEDPYLVLTRKVNESMHRSGPPGGTPVDLFPFLVHMPSWFPGTYYATFVRRNRKWTDELIHVPFINAQKQMMNGTAEPSFVTDMLNDKTADYSMHSNTIEDLIGGASTMHAAGSETTSTTMSVFIYAMLLHPECQARAREEITAVIGSDRLPEFSDRDSLPYIEAIVQETLRWHEVIPLGIPHRSLKDDIYNGMFIPKGCLLLANIRAMHLNESVYTDPCAFNPLRFFQRPEGNEEPYPITAFGFGRRICPGRHLAEASMWIAIASILATFNISPLDGEAANGVRPWSHGITSKPPTYRCRFIPRDERVRSLIVNASLL